MVLYVLQLINFVNFVKHYQLLIDVGAAVVVDNDEAGGDAVVVVDAVLIVVVVGAAMRLEHLNQYLNLNVVILVNYHLDVIFAYLIQNLYLLMLLDRAKTFFFLI